MTTAAYASSLASAATFLLPISPTTSFIWKRLLSEADAVIRHIRLNMLEDIAKNMFGGTHIGPDTFENETFLRLFSGLSGAVQLVTRLECQHSAIARKLTGISALSTALCALRHDARSLVSSIDRSCACIHPILLELLNEIACCKFSFMRSSDVPSANTVKLDISNPNYKSTGHLVL